MAFTFFFRDLQTLEHFADRFVPSVAGRSRVRVWDAGCAMGQEPYTVAILLAERMGNFAFKNLSILATDIDDEDGNFGRTVTGGVYPREELKRIPADLLGRYFEEAGATTMCVGKDIKARVNFQRHDLLSLTPPGEGFSAIVCKNVLLHFSAAERKAVTRMFHSALAPNGLLVHEHTQDIPAEFGTLFERVAADAHVYRRVA